MKRIIASVMILAIAISPLFRGLYFDLEASAFLAALALLSVIYLFIKLANKEEMLYNKWILAFGIILVAAYILSFIKAVSFRENIGSIIQISEYWLVSMILYDYYHDKKQRFVLVLMLSTVIAGFINAIIGIEALSGVFDSLLNTLLYMRVGSTFQYPNTVAVYFVICVVFATTLISTFKSIPYKLLLSGMGNIAFLALLLTASRGGFLVGLLIFFVILAIQPSGYRLKYICSFISTVTPAFMFINRITALNNSKDYLSIAKWMVISFITAALLCLVFALASKLFSSLNTRIRNGLILLGLACFLAVIVFIISRGITGILPNYIISRFARFSLNDKNIVARLTYMNDSLKLISSNWLFGYGGGGWYSLYQSVQDEFYTSRAVHNHYLQVFLEAGILGFLSFLSITLFALFNVAYSWLKQKDGKERALLAGLFCGFLALAFHSSFDFNLTYVSMALLFWTFIAGSAICLPDKDGSSEKPSRQMATVHHNGVKVILIAVFSVLLTFSGLYTASAYYAQKGFNSLSKKDYSSSRIHYLKASQLDPINPVYHFQLAKVYMNYSRKSTDPANISGWREKALQEAEKSVSLNSCYPEYREMLAVVCSESNLPLEALENTRKLIDLQPYKNSNYELLAKNYLKAADYYNSQNNLEKRREMLKLCSEIDTLPKVIVNDAILEYKQQALDLLGE